MRLFYVRHIRTRASLIVWAFTARPVVVQLAWVGGRSVRSRKRASLGGLLAAAVWIACAIVLATGVHF